jgi:hypothetical protein
MLNFLSLQPEQYAKIQAKNVLPYLDLTRYLYSATNTLNTGASQTITFSNIQLNQIPDLMIIVARYPMANQNWNWSSSFLTINGISVNFNNQSGILSSATQQQLFQLSQKNGSSQSYFEFLGSALQNDNITGMPTTVPTLGSLLILNPSLDFGLLSMYSASSAGNYNFQMNLSVINQTAINMNPELVLICVNSGMFITTNGVSATQTGILTREIVLKTKNEKPIEMDTSFYHRMIGGNLFNVKQISHMFRHHKKNEDMDSQPDDSMGSGMAASGMKHKIHRFIGHHKN